MRAVRGGGCTRVAAWARDLRRCMEHAVAGAALAVEGTLKGTLVGYTSATVVQGRTVAAAGVAAVPSLATVAEAPLEAADALATGRMATPPLVHCSPGPAEVVLGGEEELRQAQRTERTKRRTRSMVLADMLAVDRTHCLELAWAAVPSGAVAGMAAGGYTEPGAVGTTGTLEGTLAVAAGTVVVAADAGTLAAVATGTACTLARSVLRTAAVARTLVGEAAAPRTLEEEQEEEELHTLAEGNMMEERTLERRFDATADAGGTQAGSRRGHHSFLLLLFLFLFLLLSHVRGHRHDH